MGIHKDVQFGETKDVLLIEFGSGDVEMTYSEVKNDRIVLAFQEHEKPHEIDVKEGSKYSSFDEMKPPLVLSFSNVKSIDSLIHQLGDMKRDMVSATVNLCDSCSFEYPDCPASANDIKFGTGVGGDNVIKCKMGEPEGAWVKRSVREPDISGTVMVFGNYSSKPEDGRGKFFASYEENGHEFVDVILREDLTNIDGRVEWWYDIKRIPDPVG